MQQLTKSEILTCKESKAYQHIIKEATHKYDGYIRKAMNTQDKDISKSCLDKAFGIAEALNILELLLVENTEAENTQYN